MFRFMINSLWTLISVVFIVITLAIILFAVFCSCFLIEEVRNKDDGFCHKVINILFDL